MRKLHVQKATASHVTSRKVPEMAENDTFWDISWNVVIKALWFSELSMWVMSASFCWKPHPFKSSHFRVIQFARWSKWPEIRPVEISRSRLCIRSYQMFFVSCIHVEACMNYISVQTAFRKTAHLQLFEPRRSQNGRKWDFWIYFEM